MTRWLVIIDKRAKDEIKRLDKPIRLRVLELIDSLQVGDPRSRGKGLTADKSGTWSYRLGSYRVLAEIEDQTITITITKAGHRSTVYD